MPSKKYRDTLKKKLDLRQEDFNQLQAIQNDLDAYSVLFGQYEKKADKVFSNLEKTYQADLSAIDRLSGNAKQLVATQARIEAEGSRAEAILSSLPQDSRNDLVVSLTQKAKVTGLDRAIKVIESFTLVDPVMAATQGKNPAQVYAQNIVTGFQEAASGSEIREEALKKGRDLFKSSWRKEVGLSEVAGSGEAMGMAIDSINPMMWASRISKGVKLLKTENLAEKVFKDLSSTFSPSEAMAAERPVPASINQAETGKIQAKAEEAQQTAIQGTKLTGFERLGRGLGAFDTANALYEGLYGSKSPIMTYVSDVYDGLAEAFSGETVRKTIKREGKDLFEKAGLGGEKGKLETSDVLGFAYDMFGSPLAYAKTAKMILSPVTKGVEIMGKGISTALPGLAAEATTMLDKAFKWDFDLLRIGGETLSREFDVALRTRKATDIAEVAKYGLPSTTTSLPAGMREVSSAVTDKIGQFKDKMFTDDMAVQIEKFFDPTDKRSFMGKTYDKVQTLWKQAVTIFDPIFYTRNVTSGGLTNYVRGATDSPLEVEKLMSQLKETGSFSVNGQQYTRKMLEDMGIFGSQGTLELKNFLGRLQTMSEDVWRPRLLIDRLLKGDSLEQGVQVVEKSHGKYDTWAKSDIEKVLARIDPFYIWDKTMATFSGAATVVGDRLTKLFKLDKMSSSPDEATTPEYERKQMGLFGVTGWGSAIEDFTNTFSSFSGLMQKLSPWVKQVTEVLPDWNFRKDKKISEDTSGSAYKNSPTIVQDLVGYSGNSAINVWTKYYFEMFLGRFNSEWNRVSKAIQDSSIENSAAIVTSLKPTTGLSDVTKTGTLKGIWDYLSNTSNDITRTGTAKAILDYFQGSATDQAYAQPTSGMSPLATTPSPDRAEMLMQQVAKNTEKIAKDTPPLPGFTRSRTGRDVPDPKTRDITLYPDLVKLSPKDLEAFERSEKIPAGTGSFVTPDRMRDMNKESVAMLSIIREQQKIFGSIGRGQAVQADSATEASDALKRLASQAIVTEARLSQMPQADVIQTQQDFDKSTQGTGIMGKDSPRQAWEGMGYYSGLRFGMPSAEVKGQAEYMRFIKDGATEVKEYYARFFEAQLASLKGTAQIYAEAQSDLSRYETAVKTGIVKTDPGFDKRMRAAIEEKKQFKLNEFSKDLENTESQIMDLVAGSLPDGIEKAMMLEKSKWQKFLTGDKFRRFDSEKILGIMEDGTAFTYDMWVANIKQQMQRAIERARDMAAAKDLKVYVDEVAKDGMDQVGAIMQQMKQQMLEGKATFPEMKGAVNNFIQDVMMEALFTMQLELNKLEGEGNLNPATTAELRKKIESLKAQIARIVTGMDIDEIKGIQQLGKYQAGQGAAVARKGAKASRGLFSESTFDEEMEDWKTKQAEELNKFKTDNETNIKSRGLWRNVDENDMQYGTTEVSEQQQTYYKQLQDFKDAQRQEDLNKEKEIFLKKISLTANYTSQAAGMFETLYALTGKKQKEFMYIAKAMRIAEALMTGYTAVLNAYAAGSKIHPAVGAAFAAVATASTSAMIAKIIATPMAEGGLINKGSGTRDDVPIMAMRDEFVMKQDAVRHYGVNFMNAVNQKILDVPNTVRSVSLPRVAKTHFATGGIVATPKQQQKQQAPQELVINNLVDPNLMERYFSTAAGQRTLINVVSANAYTVRKAIMS